MPRFNQMTVTMAFSDILGFGLGFRGWVVALLTSLKTGLPLETIVNVLS